MPIDAERVGLSFGRTFKSQSLLSAEKNTFFVLHMVFLKMKQLRRIDALSSVAIVQITARAFERAYWGLLDAEIRRDRA